MFPIYFNFQYDFCPMMLAVDTEATMDDVAAAAAHHCIDRRVAKQPEHLVMRVRLHGAAELLPRDLLVGEAGFRPTETLDIVFTDPQTHQVVGSDYVDIDHSDVDAMTNNNEVGPVLTGGDVARAAIEAAAIDNPDKKINVDDKGAYVRISCEGELILTAATISRILGRGFEISDLEVNMGSFAGLVDSHDDYIRFYFNKSL